MLFDRVSSCLIKCEGDQTYDQKLKTFLLFSCSMGAECFVRLEDSRVSNMFDVGMRNTLAQRLVSIV